MVLDWYNSNWSHRKRITINHSQVDSDLTDYPMLVRIIDNDLDSKARADGYDIIFADTNKNKLDHELEMFSDGTLVAWVKIPLVLSANDTIIYMYYGNNNSDSDTSTNDTWSNNFVMVQHMMDDPDTSHIADSTSYENNGNKKGANEPIETSSGIIYKGQYFDGVDDFIDVPFDISLQQNEITLELWFYPEELADRDYLITWGGTSGIRICKMEQDQLLVNIRNFADTLDILHNSAHGVFDSADKWYHIVVTYSDSAQWVKAWLNGELVIDEAHTDGIRWEGAPMEIGAIWQTYHFTKGIIDEVRESGTTIRPPGYVAACYANQKEGTTFFALGDEENIKECECPTFTLYGTETNLVFPVPEWANPNNTIKKDISLFNFKSGSIDTVDRGINSQPLTIGGTITPCGIWKGLCFPICFPACFNCALSKWLDSIKDAMNNGEVFTINELGDCLNGVYVIKNFVFDTIPGSPNGFTWSLSLERKKDV